MEAVINSLTSLFKEKNVCRSHGIGHALAVLENAKNALIHYEISDIDRERVLLASLLHDADDHKFFPDSNYSNVRKILKDRDDVDQIIEMIDLVSASKYRDTIPDGMPEWKLVPRYADRLEALGRIGIYRAVEYGHTIASPLFVETTPRLFSPAEIDAVSKERYQSYTGTSISTIDHFYDKLIAASFFPITNPYLIEESTNRRDVMYRFLITFASEPNFSIADVVSFLVDN